MKRILKNLLSYAVLPYALIRERKEKTKQTSLTAAHHPVRTCDFPGYYLRKACLQRQIPANLLPTISQNSLFLYFANGFPH